MTTTTGTTEHPDVSEISDLTEGLLSPARSTEVREHLDGCALCADVHESLEEIRGLLGSLPGPQRMPADVAARVDAALAAEALLNATADVSRETSRTAETDTDIDSNADTASHEPERDSAPEREAEPAPTAVTPGATAPGATAPGATAADAPRADRPAGRPRAATGPGRTRRLRRRRGAILGAVFGTAAIGVSVLLFQTASSNGGGDYKADAGTSQADSSGDVFSGTGIQDKIHSLLASTPASGMPQMADGGTEGENSTKEGTTASPRALAQLPPCVQQATGRTDSPLAAEKGTYNGVEAFLVVLSDPVDGGVVRAYVIDAACVDVTPPVKGDLLLTKTYPRH
ncbi:zf-HC2 domain-containing protein [Streptomyces sp. NBC_01725]|uniref:anti-sigma factor family protein n=1 Tax=Streptomyces sp. NBC_01725 TaxID=2975923 RepID=UPI002E2C4EF2|nr:zf-HC2 domain-containing protein [Streptomyces sp. NBC_01725]